MNIFVGASVKNEIPKQYINEANQIIDVIVKKHYNVICCASSTGIIGSLCKKVLENDKSKIISTIPKVHLKSNNNCNIEADIVTDTINERTELVLEKADVCLFLPGGIGTIYEIFTAIETRRANENMNKIIIFNSHGFYNDLIEMLEKIYTERFANISDKKIYLVIENLEELKEIIEHLEGN